MSPGVKSHTHTNVGQILEVTLKAWKHSLFFSSGPAGCWGSWPVSMTAVTAGGWTRAGVWARLGLVLVPGGGVFLPAGVLEAAAGTSGDRGRLFGAAGDGGLFLGFGVLRGKREKGM